MLLPGWALGNTCVCWLQVYVCVFQSHASLALSCVILMLFMVLGLLSSTGLSKDYVLGLFRMCLHQLCFFFL